MLDIKITRTTAPKAKPADESKLGFGKKFSDHMFLMDYDRQNGWHDPRVVPYANFTLDPACVVFHYAQEIFEGLKAYRTADNKIQLFRPECNGARMQDSCDRLCMPKIPVEDFVQACKTLVEVDKDWVPHTDGASLYLRPFILATDVGLGVHASPPSLLLPRAHTMPRASTPCAFMWKMNTFVQPPASPALPSAAATMLLPSRQAKWPRNWAMHRFCGWTA